MLELKLLVILSGIATVGFGSTVASRSAPRLAIAAAFATTLALAAFGLAIRPSATASLIAIVALWLLLKPSATRRVTPIATGIVAGLWVASLTTLGAPRLPAAVLAVLILTAVALLAARDRRYATPVLVEEALLLIAVLGGLLAIGPGIMVGWQAALRLRAEPVTVAAPESGIWAFVVIGIALTLGALYAIWKHQRSGG